MVTRCHDAPDERLPGPVAVYVSSHCRLSRPQTGLLGAGWSQRNKRGFMMNHEGGWVDGGMWIWTAIGLMVVLLVVVIKRACKE